MQNSLIFLVVALHVILSACTAAGSRSSAFPEKSLAPRSPSSSGLEERRPFLNPNRPRLNFNQSQFNKADGIYRLKGSLSQTQIDSGAQINIESILLREHELTKQPFKALAVFISDPPMSYRTYIGPWSVEAGKLTVEIFSPDRYLLCSQNASRNVSLQIETSSLTVVTKDLMTGKKTEEPQAPLTFDFPIDCR